MYADGGRSAGKNPYRCSNGAVSYTHLDVYKRQALLHGTEQFFMDDTSRNGEAHYGIGLFFAKTVVEKYGGGIKLSNSENTGGARVEIFFLSSQETR